MIYQLIGRDEDATIEASDELVACVATIELGRGFVSLTRGDAEGTRVLPLLAFGGAEEWRESVGIRDYIEFLEDHRAEIARVLRTAAYGTVREREAVLEGIDPDDEAARSVALAAWNDDRRSNPKDLCARAVRLAESISCFEAAE